MFIRAGPSCKRRRSSGTNELSAWRNATQHELLSVLTFRRLATSHIVAPSAAQQQRTRHNSTQLQPLIPAARPPLLPASPLFQPKPKTSLGRTAAARIDRRPPSCYQLDTSVVLGFLSIGRAHTPVYRPLLLATHLPTWQVGALSLVSSFQSSGPLLSTLHGAVVQHGAHVQPSLLARLLRLLAQVPERERAARASDRLLRAKDHTPARRRLNITRTSRLAPLSSLAFLCHHLLLFSLDV